MTYPWIAQRLDKKSAKNTWKKLKIKGKTIKLHKKNTYIKHGIIHRDLEVKSRRVKAVVSVFLLPKMNYKHGRQKVHD